MWILARAIGVGVERAATASTDARTQIAVRMGFLFGRLFLLAITVILLRSSGGKDAGLTALCVIVFAFTVELIVSAADPPEAPMTRKQLLLLIAGIWLLINIVLFVIVGTHGKNNEFQIQNEFQLHNWVHLGVFSINRAVLYVFLAARAHRGDDGVHRQPDAGPAQPGADRRRDDLRRDAGPHHPGTTWITHMAARWFPFLGALFLFIWYSNLLGYLPLPTNSAEKFNLFGAHIPSFSLYAATANISVPLILALIVFIIFNTLGIRAHGPIGYVKSLVPAGITGFVRDPARRRSRSSRRSCGCCR